LSLLKARKNWNLVMSLRSNQDLILSED
jgi:hypothetical protein